MVSYLLPCATTGLSRIAGWCIIGETPWGQPWTPVLTLPHVHDGLRVLLMAVLCAFHRLSRLAPPATKRSARMRGRSVGADSARASTVRGRSL